jgi:hypothetical protein
VAQSTRSQVILYGQWRISPAESPNTRASLFLELSAFFVATHQVVLNRTYSIPWLHDDAADSGQPELVPEGAYLSIRSAIIELLRVLRCRP